MFDTIIEPYENMTFKDMDIREAKRLLKRFENQLEYWKNEREIAFEETQPSAANLDKEKVSGGIAPNTNDIYVIKLEKIDAKIAVLNKRIRNLILYIENEMKVIGEYDPIEAKIIMLRDERHMKWCLIAEAVNYSERHCRRIYDKYKWNKKMSN